MRQQGGVSVRGCFGKYAFLGCVGSRCRVRRRRSPCSALRPFCRYAAKRCSLVRLAHSGSRLNASRNRCAFLARRSRLAVAALPPRKRASPARLFSASLDPKLSAWGAPLAESFVRGSVHSLTSVRSRQCLPSLARTACRSVLFFDFCLCSFRLSRRAVRARLGEHHREGSKEDAFACSSMPLCDFVARSAQSVKDKTSSKQACCP